MSSIGESPEDPAAQRIIYQQDERITELKAQAERLRNALEGTICRSCGNRIGWQGAPGDGKTFGEIRYDWKTCESCRAARAALKVP